jgi:hypothetical protein
LEAAQPEGCAAFRCGGGVQEWGVIYLAHVLVGEPVSTPIKSGAGFRRNMR